MFISGLVPMSVLNGILGKISNSKKKKGKIFIFLGLSMLIDDQSLFSLSVKLRGFPVWLKYVPGIAFRTDNGPFKVCYLENFHHICNFQLSLSPLIWDCPITNLVSDKP